jgi:hypothetical protein
MHWLPHPRLTLLALCIKLLQWQRVVFALHLTVQVVMEHAFGRYPESNILLTNLDKLHSLGWYYKIELNDGLKLYLIRQ